MAQAIGKAVISQGYRVIYREAHILLEEIAEAALDGNRKEHIELLSTVPVLIIDDFRDAQVRTHSGGARTMGDLEKMTLRTSKRDFFRTSRKKEPIGLHPKARAGYNI